MFAKFLGPVALLLALFVGDQIRINRPDHKYRLTIEVDTPQGVKTVSGIMAVHPDRGYTQGGTTRMRGDAIALDIDGKLLVMLLAHLDEGKFDLDGINYVAVRSFAAAGQRAAFRSMDRLKGDAPVIGQVMPLLAILTDPADPATMKAVPPDDLSVFGPNMRLRGMRVEIVPNGFWPLDLGGTMGEPASRGIAKILPWVASASGPAVALSAAGWMPKPGDDARLAFTR